MLWGVQIDVTGGAVAEEDRFGLGGNGDRTGIVVDGSRELARLVRGVALRFERSRDLCSLLGEVQ